MCGCVEEGQTTSGTEHMKTPCWAAESLHDEGGWCSRLMSSRIKEGVREEMEMPTCGVWKSDFFDNGTRWPRTMETRADGCRQVITACLREKRVS